MPVQMVCDSTSLVSAALRDSLPTGGGPSSSSGGGNNSVTTSGFLEPDEDIDRIESTLAVAIKRNQLRPIRYEEVPGFGQELDSLKSKYTVLKTTSSSAGTTVNGINGSSGGSSSLMNGGSMAKPTSTSDSNGIGATQQNGPQSAGKDQLPVPKRVLYARDNVQIGWKATGRKWQTGAGMTNVGNTCYLNSTLQALFHVPAIANWLISDVTHRERCDDSNGQGGCIICAMAKTLLASQSQNQGAIKPYLVYSKLRLVCKHLVLGRQEDAHEFLRYLVEAMEKSYLARFKNSKEFDQLTKETTPLNQILGGYLRSEVKCLSCQHISTTFQHFEDLLLDIRKANSIEDALDVYFARERLEENQYKCEACKKRVAATKQFSLERAPFALCIQLKRFSMMGGKINKHVDLRNRLDLSPYCKTGKLTYRLVSMVTHLGNTQHCGHYTAIGGTESGSYYVFDDSSVRPIAMQNVTSTNAYIIFYELESVQNGIKSTASSTATSASYAASASTTGSSSSGKQLLGSNSGAPAGSTTASPLRVLGASGQSGHNPLLPSKLENRPGFIGPVLPGQPQHQTPQEKAKKLANGLSNHHIHFNDAEDDFGEPTSRLSPVSSTTSSLSSPSPNKQSRPTTLPSPKKPTPASPASVKNRFGMTITTNGVSSTAAASSTSNGTSQKPSTSSASSSSALTASTSAPTLPSMPKLCNSSAAAKNGESSGGTSSTVGLNGNIKSASTTALSNGHKAVRLVPYDDGDDDDDDEEEVLEQRRIGSNGHNRVQQHDSDEDEERLHPSAGNPKSVAPDEEEDSSCSPKSPPVIKSKTGLWKVSDNRPGSSSSSSANSSKNASPATSGNSSPANYQNHNGNATSTVTNGRNGPLASGYQTNGRQQQPYQQQQQPYQGNAFNFNGYNRNGNANQSDVVNQLQKFSHRGYGAPVRSWNGQQTHMDRELALERREDRKRQMEDDRETEMDRGRTKKVKTNFYQGNGNSGGGGYQQQRDGGNPFQSYQNNQMNGGGGMNNNGNGNNNRKWNNNGYNGNGGQRQQKFCDSNRNGGNYYQNGNNYHRNQNGFRNGGRGRNGFFNKSYNHHQRDNVGTSNGYHNNR
ncbi:ubiquitin carboxyl-terminal hydrolase 36 isoform X1 [Culex pipiens pallens]|uniref:ubiquitin carboxyl-terminal hydrolase 36 isoform X1 n=1 Tax=Culex pipiens pallens TaxID=42434 RepID=UPI0022AB2B1F|nr:ubiquitin carboxyl-terminal hydrolase 36 isoform X1 [Culex pipiens pallens]